MNQLALRPALAPEPERIPMRSLLIFGLVALALLLNSVDNTKDLLFGGSGADTALADIIDGLTSIETHASQ